MMASPTKLRSGSPIKRLTPAQVRKIATTRIDAMMRERKSSLSAAEYLRTWEGFASTAESSEDDTTEADERPSREILNNLASALREAAVFLGSSAVSADDTHGHVLKQFFGGLNETSLHVLQVIAGPRHDVDVTVPPPLLLLDELLLYFGVPWRDARDIIVSQPRLRHTHTRNHAMPTIHGVFKSREEWREEIAEGARYVTWGPATKEDVCLVWLAISTNYQGKEGPPKKDAPRKPKELGDAEAQFASLLEAKKSTLGTFRKRWKKKAKPPPKKT